MVRGRLRNFVNVTKLSQKEAPSKAFAVELPMLVRVAVVCAFVLGLFGVGLAAAEELNPEQARAFVVGKLFSYTCFDGTVGQGRIFPDGSVVGTIRPMNQGPGRFPAFPAGTIRVSSPSMCATLSGLPIEP